MPNGKLLSAETVRAFIDKWFRNHMPIGFMAHVFERLSDLPDETPQPPDVVPCDMLMCPFEKQVAALTQERDSLKAALVRICQETYDPRVVDIARAALAAS